MLEISDKTLASAGVDVKAAHKDKALALLSHNHVDLDPNSPEARRVLRKIDMRILPMIYAVYIFMLIVCVYKRKHSWTWLTNSL